MRRPAFSATVHESSGGARAELHAVAAKGGLPGMSIVLITGESGRGQKADAKARRILTVQPYDEPKLLALVVTIGSGLIGKDPGEVKVVLSGVILDGAALACSWEAAVGSFVTGDANVGPDGWC